MKPRYDFDPAAALAHLRTSDAELGALIEEARLVKKLSPVHNRQYRCRVVDPCFLDAEGVRYRV